MVQSGRDRSQLQQVNRKEQSKEIVLLTPQSPNQVLIKTNSNNLPPEETTHQGKSLAINQLIFHVKLSRGQAIPGLTTNAKKITETTIGRVTTTKTEADITTKGDDLLI